jgi:hypothetical protein
MMLKCETCLSSLNFDKLSFKPRKESPAKHLVLCKECQKTKTFYSKTKCKKDFLLDGADLGPLRFLYLSNPKNPKQFYPKDEIDQLIINKHADTQRLEAKIHIKQQSRKGKREKKAHLRKKRELQLREALDALKLPFYKFGSSFSYIETGKPTLEEVVKEEHQKETLRQQKRKELQTGLLNLKLPILEQAEDYQLYVHGTGTKNLKQTLRALEIENFFSQNSVYLKYKDIHGKEKAQELALLAYAKNPSPPVSPLPRTLARSPSALSFY